MSKTLPQKPETLRRRYAEAIARLAKVDDPRIEKAFAAVPREDFLPPPPWTVISGGVAEETSDLAEVYRDVLVALDRRQGINNGEPALHAAWMQAVEPRPGERVVHVGAGTGYYTAILAALVAPGGAVEAFEIDPALAAAARHNLASAEGVAVEAESAFGRKLLPADIVYVNAGVFAPDAEWLTALRPGGRLIFPWQPGARWGPAMLVRRAERGFSARAIMSVGFIVCAGQGRGRSGTITGRGLEATRSVWLLAERPPDDSATAIYDDLWFSADPA
jgi:protein-L-isoaspartate(D-aspartate) O-methyltransferase